MLRNKYITLKKAIYIAVICYTLILLFIVATSYICIKKLDQKVYLWIQLENIDRQILEVRRYEKNYLLYHNKQDLIYAMDYIEKLELELEKNSKFIKNLDTKNKIDELKKTINNYKTILENFIEQEKISTAQAKKIRKEGHKIVVIFNEIRNKIIQKLDDEIKKYSLVPILIIFIVLLIAPIGAYILAIWIIKPIEHLAYYAYQITKDQANCIPEYEKWFIKYKEYEQLRKAINQMINSLNNKQQELIQAEKMAAIGTTISGIAHEINNPLNNIFLTAEIIIDSFEELNQEEIQEMLQDIYKEAERAREIVAHLLEFARNKRESNLENIDLRKLVKETLKLVANEIALKGIKEKIILPEEEVFVKGNFNQLQQVLINIITNAIQAMNKGGKLEIRVKKKDYQAVIEISDTGPGIPEDIRKKIFDPFFTTKEKGTGLGLSVSYSIIQKHKGQIEVESEEGKGTIFRILLPVYRKQGRGNVDGNR
ncbi:sensor histidine kinase [Thermodesulfatator autotrophicus]|uniref:histidine kinase n=1 Tax=Thermodesulfatator autotrophicus TaxID=1795632 RepID=A0A177E4U7_9BACT|nr:ATP-binding protein [Thermodesulfatator autotrophicus]OAG26746.1 hypothetical protein TH606_10655 [Thermodesulfatator autotrophicus]